MSGNSPQATILLGGRAILGGSKKQPCTASSMMGSEYITSTTAMPEVVSFRRLFLRLDVTTCLK